MADYPQNDAQKARAMLAEIREYYQKDGKKLTQEDISAELEYNSSYVSQVLNGIKPLTQEFIDRVKEKYPKVNTDIKILPKHIEREPKGVPVYALEATAGNIEQVAQDIPEKIEGYISLASFRDCIAFLYVKGESMYPTFKSGDLVGVCPVDHEIIQYGNPYLIVTTDNQRMIKFIRAGVDEEHVILRSKNKEFDDIPMRKEKIIKLYKVKGPIRDDWQ